MLRWAIIAFVVAVIASVLGFGGIASGAEYLAGVFFIIFLALLVINLITGRKARL